MYTKHNGDNPNLRIFIPQRRRIQPNFINHTYQTTNQTNTTQTTKTTRLAWVLPLPQSTTEKTQILEYSYSNFNQFQKIHIQTIFNSSIPT